MLVQSDVKWTIEKVLAFGREETIERRKTLPPPDFEEFETIQADLAEEAEA